MKAHVYRSPKSRKWHYRITARNGRIVAQGEGYNRIGDVLKTLRAMFREGASLLSQVDRQIAENQLSARLWRKSEHTLG